jgi:pyruvate kinase
MGVRTKIVATIGPERSIYGPDETFRAEGVPYLNVIPWLFEAGVDVFRLNMSHRSEDGQRERQFFDAYRAARYRWESRKKEVALLGDLQGPKIRIGNFHNDPEAVATLSLGESNFVLHTRHEVEGDDKRVSVLYEGRPFATMTRQIEPGIQIWLGDGEALLEAREISDEDGTIACSVRSAGRIKGGRGVTAKGASFDLESFTEKDKEDLRFLLLTFGADLTYVALSFVKTAEDILKVKHFIHEEWLRQAVRPEDIRTRMPGLIAKIETSEAEKNIDEILDVADGIMIARGDLGMQLELEEMTGIQKRIAHKCNVRGKPVITATQMLDSMERNPIPTRAEVTDVYNSIFDGTDAVMLSGETSKGPYPLQAVRFLRKIAGRAEQDFFAADDSGKRFLSLLQEAEAVLPEVRARVRERLEKYGAGGEAEKYYAEEYADVAELLESQQTTDRISHAACSLSAGAKAAAIMAPTTSGQTARMVTRFRPPVPIIGATHNIFVARKLTLSFGVYPLNILGGYSTSEQIFEKACAFAKDVVSRRAAGNDTDAPPLLREGDLVIITAGYPLNRRGTTNLVKLHQVA